MFFLTMPHVWFRVLGFGAYVGPGRSPFSTVLSQDSGHLVVTSNWHPKVLYLEDFVP